MKCLVTGGAGFIGSHLADHLLRNGHEVRIIDNLVTGKLENIEHLPPEVEFMEESFTDPDTCRRAAAGMDVVFHEGAIPSVPRSLANPAATSEACVTGTLNMLTAARDAGVRRFVYAASSSVYGDTPTLPKVETMPTAPKSIYSAAKLTGEHYCQSFSRYFGLETVCLRYFNVFGPRQDPENQYAAVIPKFIVMMKRGERPTVHGDGTQTRDFTYIDNVLSANLLAATAEGIPAGGLVCNAACGDRISLLDLVAQLNEILGTNLEPEFKPTRQGDVMDSQADITLARKYLGFEPLVSFREGLEKTAEFFS